MPGKGRRVASRQAQLGQRRRRHNRGPAGDSLVTPQTAVAETEAVSAEAEPINEKSTAATTAREPAQSPQVRSVPQRNPTRARAERPVAYNYVKSEMTRILILAGVLTTVLIAITFVVK